MKILIVGAGPTGLTAALEFARNGIKVEIVDSKDKPSPLSRAVGILPKSIDILNRTNVGKDILKEGVNVSRIKIHRGTRAIIDLSLPKSSRGLIGLPQDRTESLMSQRLKEMGVDVKYGVRVESVKNLKDSVSVSFDKGRAKKYDFVIGADGINSIVRKSLKIKYEGYELDEEWSIADVVLNSGYKKEAKAWLLKGDNKERDAMVMVPIAKNRVRLVSSTPDSLAALPIKIDVKKVRRSGTFKISVRQAKNYIKGRVVLAGDAAHVHSPVGGRGMNLGIDDAQEAVKAILSNKLKEYEVDRKRAAKKVIKYTELIRKILVSNNPFVSLFLMIVTWFIRNLDFLRNKFINMVTRL